MKTVRQYPKSEHGALVPETPSVLASVSVISFPKVAASAAVTFRDFTSHCDAPADGVASTVTAFAELQIICSRTRRTSRCRSALPTCRPLYCASSPTGFARLYKIRL